MSDICISDCLKLPSERTGQSLGVFFTDLGVQTEYTVSQLFADVDAFMCNVERHLKSHFSIYIVPLQMA